MPIEYQIGLLIGIPALILIITIISKLVLHHQINQRFQESLYVYGTRNAAIYEQEVYEKFKTYHRYRCTSTDVDDITWHDLNMDEIFRQMNITQTSIGDEYLYHRLHQQTLSTQELEQFEQLTQIMEDDDYRHRVQKTIAHMDKQYLSHLSEFLEVPDSYQTIAKQSYLLNMIALYASILLIFFNFYAFLFVFMSILCFNIFCYEKLFRNYFNESQSCSYFIELLDVAYRLVQHPLPGFEEEFQNIKKHLKPFKHIHQKSILYFRNKDEKDVFTRMIKCATYIDFFTYNGFRKTLSDHQESAQALYRWLGELETAIAVSSYRQTLEHCSTPVYFETSEITFENAVHPNISEAVGNSASFDKGILISGSNASGKSTFIKTIAINMILSQSIHTASADYFGFKRSLIYTSMAITDNLETKESYYIVEIKSLKRILQAKSSQLPIICFVDEILRGTNTIERISASAAILKQMDEQNIFAFVATHDIELTEILKEYYDNYHFSEQINHHVMSFDFKLKPGFTTTKNAIALLDLYEYDAQITEEAQKLAKYFETHRSWEIITKETLK